MVPSPADWREEVPTPLAPASPPADDLPQSLYGLATNPGGQPSGVLSGKVVYMWAGHGWTYDTDFSPPWRLQRGVGYEMNEDYGNVDQLSLFATYCFNAGATVVPFRPVGHQTNAVIVDNDDAGAKYTGTWNNSSATSYYYGSSGDVPYRYSSLTATETATATYTPVIPQTGYYPIYTWVRHGSDRCDQLYRIQHTGGQSQVRVPHHMVGNGWVYLGEYYFNAGSNTALGSVVISNLRGTTNGSLIIADAIRWGNGMGKIDRGGGVSDYPSEDENCRYWVQQGLGYGMPTTLYNGGGDDESDSWWTPPSMTKEMNRELSGSTSDRISMGFHSNAGGGRGAVGLITSDPTPNQARLARLVGESVNTNLYNYRSLTNLPSYGGPAPEVRWTYRTTHTYTGGYTEIDGSVIGYEMDTTMNEVAFHDSAADTLLLRDVFCRSAIARSTMQAVVQYMNEFGGRPIACLPEPPYNLRALAASNGIALTWNVPISRGGSHAPTNYWVYRSTDGYGFGNPVLVSGGTTTNLVLTNLASDVDYYFRVSAANAGGESFPSEVAGCRRSILPNDRRILYVNAYERFDRDLNPRQDVTRQNYTPPDLTGAIERVIPRKVNSFDYVVQHGRALSTNNAAFDSCSRLIFTNVALASQLLKLTNYDIVIWGLGQQSSKFAARDRIFTTGEQAALTNFLAQGGDLFVSGSDLAYEMDRASGPAAADRQFLNVFLRCRFDADTNGGSYTVAATTNGIFAGNANGVFDNGTKGIYGVQAPDELYPNGPGASAALAYSGGTAGNAAVQYDGSSGGGKVVAFGFPFETLTSAAVRNAMMADILAFFASTPPAITAQPQSRVIATGSNTTFNVTATGSAPFRYQWRLNGASLPNATNASLTLLNVQLTNNGGYSVVITNPVAAVTSAVASLTVLNPPVITQQPESHAVTPGATVTFSLAATGFEPLYCQWRRNGTNLPGATNFSLLLSNVQAAAAGTYAAVVTNLVAQTTSSNAVLTVNDAPSIAQPPQSQVVLPGANVTFSVVAGGSPPLFYRWLWNDNPTAGTGASYSMNNVQPVKAGAYAVIVSNAFGAITSAPATLVVATPPAITRHPAALKVYIGSAVTFDVEASGGGLSYQWLLNGTNLPNAQSNPLLLARATTNHAGTYAVLVTNVAGAALSSNALLTVVAPLRFESLSWNPDQPAQILISGEPGGTYTIEYSTNLIRWDALTNQMNAEGVMEIHDDSAPAESQRFYRAFGPPETTP